MTELPTEGRPATPSPSPSASALPVMDPRQLVLPSLQAMLQDVLTLMPPSPQTHTPQAMHMLQQMGRALQVVDLPGLAQVTQAMAQALQLLTTQPELAQQGQQLLHLAAKDLRLQLRALEQGQPQQPPTLFATYRALVKLGGKDSAHPADLWQRRGDAHAAHQLRLQPPQGADLPADAGLRAALDQHVLRLIQTGERSSAATLRDLGLHLAQHAPTDALRATWYLASAWLDAMAHGLLPLDLYTKRLASRLLMLYAMQTKGLHQLPDGLQRDLLFYCDQALATAQHSDQAVGDILAQVAGCCGLRDTPADTALTADDPPAAAAPAPAPWAPPEGMAPIPEIHPTDALMVGAAVTHSVEPNQSFLTEADTLSAQLETDLQAWVDSAEHSPLPAHMAPVAATLTRSAWAAGCTDISTLAFTLQRVLERQPAQLTTTQRQTCRQAAAELRRLLHQFAAGFMRRPHPQIVEALHAVLAQCPELPPAELDTASVTDAASAPLSEEAAGDAAPAAADDPAPAPAAARNALDPVRFAVLEEEFQLLWPQLQKDLQQWLAHPQDSTPRQAVLRALHTLKGSARMAGAMAWGSQVHALEDLVLAHTQQPQQLPQPLEALRLAFVALQQEMAIRHPEHVGQQHLRQRPLDAVARHAQALWSTHDTAQTALGQGRTALDDIGENLLQLRAAIKDCTAWADSLMLHGDLDLSYEWHEELGDMVRALHNATDDLGTIQRNLQHELQHASHALHTQGGHLRALQHTLLYARLVPLGHVASRLHDTVRLAALETGKQAQLEIEGDTLTLERETLEALTPALEHLLRNCVDHGIERPALRRVAGKPEQGRIQLQLRTVGHQLQLVLQDDGAGVDAARIHAKAIAMGLDPALAEGQNDMQSATRLMLQPGLSTASDVTERSGRGIGMEAVVHHVHSVGGQLAIDSTPGQGCRFTITLPAPPQVEQVLAVRAGNWRMAMPASGVQALRRLPYTEVQQALAQGMLRDDSSGPIPLYWTGAVWQQSSHSVERPLNDQALVLIVRSDTRRWALLVDEVLGTQEVVLHPPAASSVPVPGLLGTAVQPSGEVLQVYEPGPVVSAHEQRQHTPTAPLPDSRLAPLVLLADDSLSVRRLAQHLLQSQGYRVHTAADGLQALEYLEHHPAPDLMLIDIEMPHMGGLELLQRLRSDARWRQLPAVMLTAHEAGPVSQQALELGAQAFLTKPYSPTELLAQVQRYSVLPQHEPAPPAADDDTTPTTVPEPTAA